MFLGQVGKNSKIEILNRSEFRARRWFPMVPRVGGRFGYQTTIEISQRTETRDTILRGSISGN